jgi:hypothetical protein
MSTIKTICKQCEQVNIFCTCQRSADDKGLVEWAYTSGTWEVIRHGHAECPHDWRESIERPEGEVFIVRSCSECGEEAECIVHQDPIEQTAAA